MKPKGKLCAEARKGLDDLFWFSNHYVGLTLEEQPHREMCSIIEDAELHPDVPNSMLVVPRGTYKSSITIASVTWKLLRQYYYHDNVYHRIIIASATLALGKAMLGAIEGTWRSGGKNQRINEDYGNLWLNRDRETPGSKTPDGLMWSARIQAGETAEVKEPTVFIGSMRRISTGFHADEAVLDDLNNKDNVKTDHQRKMTHTYYRLIYPILGTTDRGGNPTKITIACTPWHDDDVRGMIIREEKEQVAENKDYVSSWRVLQRSSYNDDGTAYFPSKYPVERLEKLRSHIGPKEFAANYLCDPVGNSGFVEEEMIAFKSAETFPGDLRHGRISVDPNQHKDAKELGCYAAIVVTAYDRFAKMYVLDACGSREWSTSQFIDELFRIQDLYYGWPIFMEDSHMSHFMHAVSLEETRRSEKEGKIVRLRIHYMPIDYKTSKYERWEKLQPRFRNRAIVFSDGIPASIKLEIKDELVRGEASRFKDFLDALAMAETGYRPRLDRNGQPLETVHHQPGEAPVARGVMTFAEALGPEWEQFQ